MKINRIVLVVGIILATILTASVSEASTTSGSLTGSETWSNKVDPTGDVTVTPTGSLKVVKAPWQVCSGETNEAGSERRLL